MENSAPRKSQSCEILNSSRKEIHNYHGVVHPLSSGSKEDDQHTNGTLSIIQQGDKVTIEWRPNDTTVDTECQEEEWALVNSRVRTSSGCGSGRGLSIKIEEVGRLRVSSRKNKLTLFLKDSRQKVFFFHFENVNHFIDELRSVVTLNRSYHDGNTFVVSVGDEDGKGGLAQSFSDLTLVEKSGDSVWKIVDGLKQHPYETTLSTFSKLTEILLYRSPEVRPEGEMVELLTSSLRGSGVLDGGGEDMDGSYHIVCPIRTIDLQPRGEPLSLEQWRSAFDETGKLDSSQHIKDIIFRGGVVSELRGEVWKFLLGFFPWDSTEAERADIVQQKTADYFRMKKQWKTINLDQESRFMLYRDKKNLVEKDVNRTDRTIEFYAGENNPHLELLSDVLMTYVMYNFDLGYVQGMSDLLSPILAILPDEVEAFWCFVGFMNIMYHNFDEDQSGMKKQLSQLHTLLTAVAPDLASYLDGHEAGSMCFCFRWLLVWFKREFSIEDVNKLWEVLWTGLPCPNFHLVICVAILEKEKNTLMSENFGLSEILKHVNDLSSRLEVDEILMRATAIYQQLQSSSNLTTSTLRVLGLSRPPSSNNTEESYQRSIDLNYF